MTLPLTRAFASRRAGLSGDEGFELPRAMAATLDRGAFVPRVVLLGFLLVSAVVDIHPDSVSHWVVLGGYGLTTAALAAAARLPVRHALLPWAGTLVDAGLAVYVIAEHLPRDVYDAHRSVDSASLLPAILLLLQTGLTLRIGAVLVFAGFVIVGWVVSVAAILSWPDVFSGAERTAVLMRQAHGLAAFVAATVFVVAAVTWMRRAAAAAWHERKDRLLISRFLPEGVAADVIRGDHSVDIAERHGCILSVDIRGSSKIARDYPASETVAWLLKFRRIVHDAVSWRHGIVDKYLGDGVLVLFLSGSPQEQAEHAVAAGRTLETQVRAWNFERLAKGEPPLRVIVALHAGRVLAGVFDDGHRAEFTVLGSCVNALPRIERFAKEANVDAAASLAFLDLLTPATRAEVTGKRLLHGDPDLPEIATLHLWKSVSAGVGSAQPHVASTGTEETT